MPIPKPRPSNPKEEVKPLADGDQKKESNYESPEEKALNETIKLYTDNQHAQKTLMPLNGIYGYVNDNNTGEKVYLSLTPYEISPRLGDPNLFRADINDFDADLNKKIKSNNIKKSLSTALTVSNRLNAAKVTTNFMQEVLSPTQDDRFSSKDDRIGEISRMFDNSGEEKDRSAFMHIVPDVEETGGKIPITYTMVDENGEVVEKDAVAYMPVNFNFINSAYTLTIKEFILSQVNEANQEIYTLDKTFDGVNLRFFGSQPKIITFNGLLTNFDDDIIGVKNEEQRLYWNGRAFSLKNSSSPKKGSMRDTFMSYYYNFLAGTKCKDFSMKLYIYYNWTIVEGFLVTMDVRTSAENDNVVSFSASMIVKRQYNVFEAGRGLASSLGFGSNNNLNVKSEKNKILQQDTNYRMNYRTYAIENTIRILEGKVKDNNSNGEGSNNNSQENLTSNNQKQLIIGFNKTNKNPDETYWFNNLCYNIKSIIFNYSFDPLSFEVKNKPNLEFEDLLQKTPEIETWTLYKLILSCFGDASTNVTTPWILKKVPETLNEESFIIKSIGNFVIQNIKNNHFNNSEGRRSNFYSLQENTNYKITDLVRAQNEAFYTYVAELTSQGILVEAAINQWLEEFDPISGNKK